MKIMRRPILATVIALAVAFGVFATVQSASAVTKWTAPPDTITAAEFCDDATNLAWYQAQHWDFKTSSPDFTGATVACSGWAAIYNIALVNGYPSVDAAAADGWSVGNRNRPWVSDLQNIGNFTP